MLFCALSRTVVVLIARREHMNKQLLDTLIADVGMEELVHRIFTALGGKANVIAVDSCMTRLRVTLHDRHVVNTEDLKALGAFSVFDMG
ncbi:PTS system glucose-specific EIICBA component [compost metagenome]